MIEAADESARERRALHACVLGEAGAGKSRLLWEFFKYPDGIEESCYWHQGRSLSYGEGVGYWALAEMVRARSGILEEDDPAAAREKLHATVARFVPDDRDRRLVEPRLAHLLRLEERPDADRADLFSGWRLFFERLSDEAPVILAFEDVQWADSGLLDFVDYLLEWSAEFPIFVLTLARPELAARRPGWRSQTLGFLEPEAIATILEGLAPGLPDELVTEIGRRSEGVPCTPWRRSGCSGTAAYSCRRARDTRSGERSRSWRCPRRCKRWSRLARRTVRRRALAAAGRLCARSVVHGSRRSGAQRAAGGGGLGGARRVGDQAAAGARRRPAVAGARTVRIPPGAAADSRVRDAVAQGSQGASRGSCPSSSADLAGRGTGHRRGAGGALPRGDRRRAGRGRCRHAALCGSRDPQRRGTRRSVAGSGSRGRPLPPAGRRAGRQRSGAGGPGGAGRPGVVAERRCGSRRTATATRNRAV
jgi:AAA ATPase domain